MFIAELGVSLNCTTSCGNRGVDIRFPFWIKDRQPDQCGYPGFALSCNEEGNTVLELPTAGKLHIEKIDYKNQVIHASDPQRCLLRQHSNFNSSVFNIQFEIPNCGSCEATGKQCGLRKNSITELETECYGLHKERLMAVYQRLVFQIHVKKTSVSSRAGRATCALDPSTLFEVFLRAGFLILSEGYCRLLLYESRRISESSTRISESEGFNLDVTEVQGVFSCDSWH
ncbi:hypothetical protein DKX38_011813 [Salix brachista]|uniref:RING-type E3 ubiquitin transferase n=1 Tax=Salix brachista TaxID=2182728 RepID=A0A5N5M013_9ROSI|nr:hypothetical protein DKX38_011813 [Salix brachista]